MSIKLNVRSVVRKIFKPQPAHEPLTRLAVQVVQSMNTVSRLESFIRQEQTKLRILSRHMALQMRKENIEAVKVGNVTIVKEGFDIEIIEGIPNEGNDTVESTGDPARMENLEQDHNA